VTTTDEDRQDVRPGRQVTSIVLAVLVAVPALFLRIATPHLAHPLEAVLFGLAIVGAAFLLSWAAEVAQLDISAGLAIALLALIAVLPEYAVDLVFAKDGGQAFAKFGVVCQSTAEKAAGRESPCSLALANMTGSNRLLIGVGWTMVVFIAWWKHRQRGEPSDCVVLERSHAVEVSFLAAASAYCVIVLPIKHTITLVDAAILVGIFVGYTIRLARAPGEEPHLVGPARYLGTFATARRRVSVVAMFVVAAAIIALCAEHFAEALVATGQTFGISEFFLVQWLAPLASEAPELLVAGMYAWRLNTSAGLGTLVSSKVNQWTLLVGTLPVAFAAFGGTTHGLPIDAAQREELLLTAAQSVFAVATLASLSLSTREAMALFVLFWTQFLFGAFLPAHLHGKERVIFSVVYLVLAVGVIVRERNMRKLITDGFRTPYAEMSE
jgi:cation:H+ antiporter